MKESQRPKKYLCDVQGCDKRYSRPCLLNQHKRSHLNIRPFVCDQCGKNFYRESHLRSHQWTHSQQKPLYCQYCHKGFVTGQQLSRHLKSHQQEIQLQKQQEQQKLECPYECSQRFSTQEELSTHMLQEHVISDTVDIQTHLDKIAFDIVDQDKPELNVADWNISDWTDHHCKEVYCLRGPRYPTLTDLLNHYDERHRFVPETLLHQDFSLGPMEQLSEPVDPTEPFICPHVEEMGMEKAKK